MKINSQDTYGGRVIQLLSCRIDGLTIEGYIRPAKYSDIPAGTDNLLPYQGMRQFEQQVRSIMYYHEVNKAPVHFTFDEVGWDG